MKAKILMTLLILLMLQSSCAISVSVSANSKVINIATRYDFTVRNINGQAVSSGDVLKITLPTGLTASGVTSNIMPTCVVYTLQVSPLTTNNRTSETCTYNGNDGGSRTISYTFSSSLSNLSTVILYVGNLKNPNSARSLSSFIVKLGSDTNSSVNGVTYIAADLSSASVSNSLKSAGSYNTLTFTFRLTNSIPQDGKIVIGWPLEERFVKPDDEAVDYITVSIYGVEQSGFTTDVTGNQSVIIENLFPSAALSVQADDIVITISDFQNPTTNVVTDSFSITTQNSDSEAIDERSTGLTIQATDPGVITIESLSQDVTVVDGEFSLTVYESTTFEIPDSSSATLHLYWPEEITYNGGAPTGVLVLGFSGAYSISLSGSGDYLILKNYESTHRLYTVGTFTNPLGAITTSSWKMYVYDSSNDLIVQQEEGVTLTINSQEITVDSLTRTDLTVDVKANYEITFTTTSRMLSDSTVKFYLPIDQVTYTGSTKCKSGSTYLACTFTSTNSTHFETEITQWCNSGGECPAGSQLSLTLESAKNPGWVVSPLTSSIIIQTINVQLDGNPVIDETSGTIQFESLKPGTLTDIRVNKDDTGDANKVGAETSYTIIFTISTNIGAGGQFKFTFPEEAVYKDSSTDIECTDNSDSSVKTCTAEFHSDTNVSTLTITDACTSGCSASTAVSFTISKVLNPGSTKPISTDFEVNTQTSLGYVIDLGTAVVTNNFELKANAFNSLTLTAPTGTIVVGAVTTYQFTIVPYNEIPSSGGKLLVQFPIDIDLLSTGSCSVVVSGVTHTCSKDSSTNKTTLTFSSDIEAGASIALTFTNSVRNPTLAQQSKFIEFMSSVDDYDIDQSLTSIRVEPNTYGTLTGVTVARVDSSLIGEATNINVKATSANPILAASKITFKFSLDQMKLPSGGLSALTFYELNSDGSVGSQLPTEDSTPTSDGSYVTVIIKEWCSENGADCPESTQNIKLRVNGFENPISAKPPSNSIQIFVNTNDGIKIDSKESSLFATPSIQAGPLASVTITRDTDVVGAATTYTIEFETTNTLTEAGGIYLSFASPSGLLYQGDSVSCAFGGNSVTSSNCGITTTTVTLGEEITNFRVPMDCGGDTCGVGTYTVTFTGLKNPFSTEAPTGTITVATQGLDGGDYYNNDVLDVDIATDEPGLQTLTAGSASGTVVRSVESVDTQTEITCEITLTNRIEAGSYIRVKVPLEQFQKSGSSVQYKEDGSGSAIAMTTVSTDSDYVTVEFEEFCSSGADLCGDGATQTIVITQGFKNARAVIDTFSNYFVFQSYTPDQSNLIDESTDDIVATPDLEQASITDISISFESSVVSYEGYVEVSAVLGATLISSDELKLTFSDEFLLQTGSSVTCGKVVSGSETALTCSTSFTSGYLNSVTVKGLCPCDSTSSYTIRLNNVGTLLEAKAFSGTMSIDSTAQDESQEYKISSGNLDLSTIATLTAAELTDVTVERSAASQGSDAIFTLAFTTPGELIDGSTIVLGLPFNQIVKSGSSFSCKDASSGFSLACSETPAADSSYNYLTISEWKCSSANCNSETTFSIELSNAQNPAVATVSVDPFLIDFMSPSSNAIFQAPDNLEATPELEIGALNNHIITHQNEQYTLSTTEYLISFQTTSAVPAGGKIIFTFPDNRIWKNGTSGVTVTSGSDYSTTVSDVTVTYDATGVWVTQVELNSYCSSGCAVDNYYFKLSGGISNPDYVPEISGNFVTYTADTTGAIVNRDIIDNDDVTPILPTPMTATITRDVATLGDSTPLTVDFTTTAPFPDAGKIMLYMPVDQISLGSSTSCYQTSAKTTAISCSVVTTDDFYIITLDEWCTSGGVDCTSGTSLSFYVDSVINPNFLSANIATTSWQVLTADADSRAIGGAFTDLFPTPELEGVDVSVITASVSNAVVYTDTTLLISFRPNSNLPSNALIDITLPTSFARSPNSNSCKQLLPSSASLSCTYSSSGGYLTTIQVTNPCSNSACSSSTLHTYQVAIKIRENTMDVGGSFSITTKTSSQDIGIGSYANSITIKPNPFASTSFDNGGCDYIGASCSLTVKFTTVYDFPNKDNGGKIDMTLPSDLTISSTGCTAKIGTSTMECNKVGTSVTATHSLTSSVAKQNISITFASITNPSSTKPTESFVIYSQEEISGTYYSIDGIESDFEYSVEGLGEISSVTVTRDSLNSDNDGLKVNRNTNFLFTFTIATALSDSDSAFTIITPDESDAKVSSSATSYTCSASDCSTGAALTCSANSSTGTVLISSYCSTANSRSCSAGATISICLKSTFMQNMGWIKDPLSSTDSFTIKSGLAGGLYFIDGISESVTANPELIPDSIEFISPEISRSSNTVNDLVTWTFTIKFASNSLSKNGYMIMTLPDNVLYDVDESIDATLVTNSSAAAGVSYTSYSSGAIKTFTFTSVCGSSGCAEDSFLTLTLEWIKNPPAVITVTDTIKINSLTTEGWIIDEGETSSLDTMFSTLEVKPISSVVISPDDPTAGADTNYDIIFSADTDIPKDSILVITLPEGVTVSDNNSGGSSSLDTCADLFDSSVEITCTVGTDENGRTTITIEGLFPEDNNSGQFGVDIGILTNPNSPGNTGPFEIEIISPEGDPVASETTDSTAEIKEAIDDEDCDTTCATCSGTTTSCDSCTIPSDQPFLQDNTCVDSCSSGYFLYGTECYLCHQSCAECSGYQSDNCLSCNDGYYFEDGECVTSCSKNTEVSNGQCVSNSTNGECNASCATCSKDTDWCLTCVDSSDTPIVNPVDGTCVANQTGACDTGYYVDVDTSSCQKCSSRCKDCEFNSTSCFECWDYFTDNILDWASYTCRSTCSSNTFFDEETNSCPACNPVCATCTTTEPTGCVTCSETPGGKQLYFDEDSNECVLTCRRPYVADSSTNICTRSTFDIVSVPSLILLVLIVGAIITLIITQIVYLFKRKKAHPFECAYAYLTAIEFVSRLFLLANLWASSKIFSFAVCFMDLITTGVLGVFFYNLFLEPIFIHSPYFRTLYRKKKSVFLGIVITSFIVGVNFVRIIGTFIQGATLTEYYFYVKPLNNMANFTAILTITQIILCIVNIFEFSVGQDAWDLSAFGLAINFTLLLFQIVKILQTRRFERKYQALDTQED